MAVHGMMLVRNEADRWLSDVLEQMNMICDDVTIIDDASTDGTAELCRLFKCDVHELSERTWTVNELSARQRLWEITTRKCKENDWILCLDADELFVTEHIPYIKYLFDTLSNDIDAMGFRLHDMWNDTHYRDDAYWMAHLFYWPMAVRYQPDSHTYDWHNKTLHCGRFPADGAQHMLPTMIPIKHMGWSTQEDRQRKYDRYMEIDPKGENGILEQYNSILDINPPLQKFMG